ncbi:MAG TPA: hypothetical protein VE130_06125 [Nitrososphaeraceae archaeon]|nr:hypothetical protein [Nitrososphaeraceae archaeon]
MPDKSKPWIQETSLVLLFLFLSASTAIVGSASGQKEEDINLSFIEDLNQSSYSKLVEDEYDVNQIATAVREVGKAIMANSSLCSIIDDISSCNTVAVSLTGYLSDYSFDDAVSKSYGARDRLAEFQSNPSFETLEGFANANSDVAKSMYELLTRTTTGSDAMDNILSDDGNRNDSLGSTALSMILIEAGQVAQNDAWVSDGERLMTVISNFEQKYTDINSITHIVNSIDVASLPRNEFGFYAIGFAVAGVLIAGGITIQLLLKRKKQN